MIQPSDILAVVLVLLRVVDELARRSVGQRHIQHGEKFLRRWIQPPDGEVSPVHLLERGEMPLEEFERVLAGALAAEGSAVEAEGLVGQMLVDLAVYEDSMTSLVTRAHAAGVRTALLSNSWGNDYDRSQWHEMFDAVVISGEVGMRKPEPAIFAHAVELLGVEAAETVFVDDLRVNVTAAAGLGFVGVHHVTYDQTAVELEALFGVPLRE